MKPRINIFSFRGAVSSARILVFVLMSFHSLILRVFAAGPAGLHIRQERSSAHQVLVSRPNDDDLTVARLIVDNGIRTIEDYAGWLKEHLRYQKASTGDKWLSVGEILSRQSGDCEDFAMVTSAFVRVMGYQPRFFAFERQGRAHAVCAFREDGYFVWFDNARIKKTDAQTLDEFKRHMTSQYRYHRVLEYDLQNKTWSNV